DEIPPKYGMTMVKLKVLRADAPNDFCSDRSDLQFADIIRLCGRPEPKPAEAWIRMNVVSTIDGSLTGGDGLSASISSESDRLVFRALRCLTDVVLVAAGTVRDEGYVGALIDDDQRAWRLAAGLGADPEFAIVTRSLDL